MKKTGLSGYRKKGLLCLFTVFSMLLAPLVSADDNIDKRSTRDFGWLIGEWRFSDASTDLAGFDYREDGVMVCSYTLDDSYIACASEGGNGDKIRHYINYFNYNNLAGRYEMTGIFGNHPAKSNFTMSISEDGQTVTLIGAPLQNRNGTISKNWGQIKRDGDNRFVWETRLNRSTMSPDKWPLSFIGQYERVKDDTTKE